MPRRQTRQKPPDSVEQKLAQLDEQREAASQALPATVDKQHRRGKQTARERVDKLLDAGSFQELDTFMRHRATPYAAAERGYVDDVIAPRETRPKVIAALEALQTKRVPAPKRKHGNIPL